MNDDNLREAMSLRSLVNSEKYQIEVTIGRKWKDLIDNI